MPTWLIWFAKRMGHWVVYIILTALVAWAGYVTIVRPHTKPPTTSRQEAENMENFYHQPRISFGCANWKVYRNAK